jgi:CheY-like chemotaxis protein
MARRVLLVDDEPEIREVTQVSLELMAGWHVLTAGSGAEGVARAAAEQPDAILLDLMMPEMDGIATLQALRASTATSHIPVILLSAVAHGAASQRFADLGAAGVIAKPFDVLTLAGQIATLLGWDPGPRD